MPRVRRRIALIEPEVTSRMVAAAAHALRREPYLRGPSVDAFERAYARAVGTQHAVALNNGTNALLFALQALGVGPGDEVVTSSASFIATANAVRLAGAVPVFADIDPATGNLDPQAVAELLETRGRRVRALVPVHLYGWPADLPRLGRLARRQRVALVEDACQAHGASLGGRAAGAWGDAAAFSFYPSKNMTVAGDGGMLTTNHARVARYAQMVRDGGRDPRRAYVHPLLGTTARLASSSAAIGLLQLRRLPAWNRRRRALARRYTDAFADVSGLRPPPTPPRGLQPAWHLYVVRARRRDALRRHLERHGIATGVHYPIPIHRQGAYRGTPSARARLPATDQWSREVLSLPMHPRLARPDQDRVIRAVRGFFGQRGVPA